MALTSFGLAYALQCGPDAHRNLAAAEALDVRVFDDDLSFGQPIEARVWLPFARGYARIRVGDLAGLAADRDLLTRSATAVRRLPIFAAAAAQWFPLETMLTGPLDDAESQINAVLEHTGDEPMFLAGHAIQTWWLRILQGDLDGATTIADMLVAMLPPDMLSGPLYPMVPRAEAGDTDAVAAHLAAIDGGPLSMIQPDWTRAATLFHLAQAAHVAGDAALGAAVYDLLRPYDGQLMLFVCTHVPGSAAHALGRAAAATGDRRCRDRALRGRDRLRRRPRRPRARGAQPRRSCRDRLMRAACVGGAADVCASRVGDWLLAEHEHVGCCCGAAADREGVGDLGDGGDVRDGAEVEDDDLGGAVGTVGAVGAAVGTVGVVPVVTVHGLLLGWDRVAVGSMVGALRCAAHIFLVSRRRPAVTAPVGSWSQPAPSRP